MDRQRKISILEKMAMDYTVRAGQGYSHLGKDWRDIQRATGNQMLHAGDTLSRGEGGDWRLMRGGRELASRTLDNQNKAIAYARDGQLHHMQALPGANMAAMPSGTTPGAAPSAVVKAPQAPAGVVSPSGVRQVGPAERASLMATLKRQSETPLQILPSDDTMAARADMAERRAARQQARADQINVQRTVAQEMAGKQSPGVVQAPRAPQVLQAQVVRPSSPAGAAPQAMAGAAQPEVQ